jgi:hypothetical protein
MCRPRENGKPVMWLVAGTLLLAVTMPVAAAGDASDHWKFDATLYLWGAGIDADTQTGGEIDISFDDILNDLDMAFMGSVGARKGKWSLAADTIYLDISQDEGGSETIPVLGPVTVERTVDTDIDMKASITTFGGGYNLVDNERVALDLMAGGRYAWVDVSVKLDLDRAGTVLQTSRQEKVSDSKGVWDGIVGARGEIHLNDHWYLPYYADVGTGQSDLTWQALAGVGYRFRWGDVLAAYRYLDYDFDSNFLLKNLTVSGPALGARFHF